MAHLSIILKGANVFLRQVVIVLLGFN